MKRAPEIYTFNWFRVFNILLLMTVVCLAWDLKAYRIPLYLFECLCQIFCLCSCQIFYQILYVCTRQFLFGINVWTSRAGALRSQRGGTSVKSCELLHVSIPAHPPIHSCTSISPPQIRLYYLYQSAIFEKYFFFLSWSHKAIAGIYLPLH